MRLVHSFLATAGVVLILVPSCFQGPDSRDYGRTGADASTGGAGSGGGSSDSGLDGTVGDGGPCTASSDCDDQNPCNGTEVCSGQRCMPGVLASNGLDCTVDKIVNGPLDGSAGDGSVREAGIPDAAIDAAGVPSIVPVAGSCYDGLCLQKCTTTADCDDGNPCTGLETCDGSRAVCVQGISPVCEDGSDCTADSCDPVLGDPGNEYCLHTLIDFDLDGHASNTLGACGDDCLDSDETVFTGAPELCDAKDNDCDGNPETGQPFWYVDCDSDGFSASTQNAVQQCVQPAGAPLICAGVGTYTLTAPSTPETQDCNDAQALAHPGGAEVCDNIDNDCSGVADDVAPKYWADCDNDNYAATSALSAWACTRNAGPPATCGAGATTSYWTTIEPVAGSTDCNDADATRNPGEVEDCDTPNSIDDNCDGVVDKYYWYIDCDDDGYAAATTGRTSSCLKPTSPPAACTTGDWTKTYPIGTGDDCDDGNKNVYPNTTYRSTQDPSWVWDFNCDGQVSKQYTTTNVSTSLPCTTNLYSCSGTVGWTGSTIPECGVSAQFSQCTCVGTFGICTSCNRETVNKAQGCR